MAAFYLLSHIAEFHIFYFCKRRNRDGDGDMIDTVAEGREHTDMLHSRIQAEEELRGYR